MSLDVSCFPSGEGDLLILWSDSVEVFKLVVLLLSWVGEAGLLPDGEFDLLRFSSSFVSPSSLGDPDLLLLCFGDPDLLRLRFASGDPDLLRFASEASGEPDLLRLSSATSAPSFVFSGLLLPFCFSSAWTCGSSWALVGVGGGDMVLVWMLLTTAGLSALFPGLGGGDGDLLEEVADLTGDLAVGDLATGDLDLDLLG